MQPIPRAQKDLPEADFGRLLDLCLSVPWLRRKQQALLELWHTCTDETKKQLVLELLQRFEMVDSNRMDQLCQRVVEQIVGVWGFQAANTTIVAAAKGSNADGSQAFLQALKNKFPQTDQWNETHFCNTLASLSYKDGWNYVLVDDFIGTGRTIRKRAEVVFDRLKAEGKKDCSVGAVALAGMHPAQQCLSGLEARLFCPLWLKRGIRDHVVGPALTQANKDMGELEALLAPAFKQEQLSKYSFGHGKAEALFSLEPYNVPNSVFPLFWWPQYLNGDQRQTLFRRLL